MLTRRRTVRAGVLGAVAVLASALAACTGSSSPAPARSAAPDAGVGVAPAAAVTTKVTVGVIPIIDVAPLYLGIKRGIFAEQGLEVFPQPAQGGAAIIPAVASGQAQFGFSNVVSLMSAREGGVKVVATIGGSTSTGNPTNDVNAVLVGKGSTLKSPKDLEGKTVAVNARKNIGEITIQRAVQKAGGDPRSVNFTADYGFPQMPAALAAGKVDAVWVSEPFVSQVVADGGRVLFDNLTETYPRVQLAVYFTSDKLRQENPKLVTAFTAAMTESLDYAAGHPDEVRAILSSYTTLTPDAAARVHLPVFAPELDRESATVLGAAALSFDVLKKAPDLALLYGN